MAAWNINEPQARVLFKTMGCVKKTLTIPLLFFVLFFGALTCRCCTAYNPASQKCGECPCSCSSNPLTDVMPEGDKIYKRSKTSSRYESNYKTDSDEDDEDEDEFSAEDVSSYFESWDL
jgi:hypothetical protein